MTIALAIKLARGRKPITKRGKTSISRMAAVLSDGRLAWVGFNSYRSHPLAEKWLGPLKPCLHAELDALRQAILYFTKITGRKRSTKVDLSGFSLYVSRVLSDDSIALAKPCSGCAKALEYFGVKNVYWTI